MKPAHMLEGLVCITHKLTPWPKFVWNQTSSAIQRNLVITWFETVCSCPSTSVGQNQASILDGVSVIHEIHQRWSNVTHINPKNIGLAELPKLPLLLSWGGHSSWQRWAQRRLVLKLREILWNTSDVTTTVNTSNRYPLVKHTVTNAKHRHLIIVLFFYIFLPASFTVVVIVWWHVMQNSFSLSSPDDIHVGCVNHKVVRFTSARS